MSPSRTNKMSPSSGPPASTTTTTTMAATIAARAAATRSFACREIRLRSDFVSSSVCSVVFPPSALRRVGDVDRPGSRGSFPLLFLVFLVLFLDVPPGRKGRDVEDRGVGGTEVEHRDRPFHRARAGEHRGPRLGQRRVDREPVGERRVELGRQDDRGVVGDLELHRDDGVDSAVEEILRDAGERIGGIGPCDPRTRSGPRAAASGGSGRALAGTPS